MSITWWVEGHWMRGRDDFAEYQVRIKPHPEAWRREAPDLFWHTWVPDLPFLSQEEADAFHSPRRKERTLDRLQGHFAFPYVDYHPRYLPTPDNPHALEWLLKGLPGTHRKLVRPAFEEAWSLILFLNRFPRVADLYSHNRVLAELLFWKFGLCLHQGVEHPKENALNAALCGRQRDLLPFLDLPAEERIVRVLKKTDLSAMQYFEDDFCDRLRDILDEPVLYHVPSITMHNWSALKELKDTLLPLTASFVLKIPDSDESIKIGWASRLGHLRDIVRMTGIRLPAIRSFAHLDRMLVKTEKWVATEDVLLLKMVDLPVHPWPGTDQVRPLATPLDYVREGITMRNCIISRLTEAEKGCVAHYRIFTPERATLEVRNEPEEGWVISDLKGRFNRELDRNSLLGVEELLRPFINKSSFFLEI